nr:NBS-containing resistance-like protein [Tanacetum cinerariifolium]
MGKLRETLAEGEEGALHLGPEQDRVYADLLPEEKERFKADIRCPATRRSTSGYYVFLGDNLLTWSSKRQDTLSRSSTKVEYRGVANVVAETSWIRNILYEIHTLLFTATLVYCDNVSAVYMSANPVQHHTGDLYPLHISVSAFALLTNNNSLWHQHLGHPGDDVIHTLSSRSLVTYNKTLNTCVVPANLGPLNYFLGIPATHTTSGIFLSKKKYAIKILEQAHMLNCNPYRTPIDTEKKLRPKRSLLCLYMHDPQEPHLNAMKRVLRYLRETTDLLLQLFRVVVQNVLGRQNKGQRNYARGAVTAGNGGVQNIVGNENPGQARKIKC